MEPENGKEIRCYLGGMGNKKEVAAVMNVKKSGREVGRNFRFLWHDLEQIAQQFGLKRRNF